MEHENSKRNDSVFSRKIRAGRRRTYFFDVRTTRGNDYYLTITESKKRFDGNGYERHKLFIYKEDFNKFLSELTEVVDHIKGLMPDFDFDAFAHKYDENGGGEGGYEGHNDNYGDDHHNDNHNDNNNDQDITSADDHKEDNTDTTSGNGSSILDDDDLKL
ncbi:MAG TPA: DUF3276 family protein [Chitinophagales bacterium]|nr:DUF3276 family protein [Chitinophagales bacterium]HRG84396.1 DUF3276 family protein [Chitinophagales bacterium]HRH54883.1 DUF3276 family protein [Chitinophagales bacterium]